MGIRTGTAQRSAFKTTATFPHPAIRNMPTRQASCKHADATDKLQVC